MNSDLKTFSFKREYIKELKNNGINIQNRNFDNIELLSNFSSENELKSFIYISFINLGFINNNDDNKIEYKKYI